MSESIYLTQFENIRRNAKIELQRQAKDYVAKVQSSTLETLAIVLEKKSIAKQIAMNALEVLRCTSTDTIVTLSNDTCVLSIHGIQLLLDMSVENVHKVSFLTYPVISNATDVKFLQTISDKIAELMDYAMPSELAVRLESVDARLLEQAQALSDARARLSETIHNRLFTVYDIHENMSFYTLNRSEDATMLFWDRYTVVNETAKSFYFEQHCIIESLLTGEVQNEQFIALHKPSKNQVPAFLADRHVALEQLQRPYPKNYDVNKTSPNSYDII